jgi:hypothetical protein
VRRILAILLLTACDPAITTGYMGEPIGELHGEITSEFPDAPGPAEVILAWVNWHSAPGTVVGTRAQLLASTFPAGFTITLHHPPPELALNTLPEGRYAGSDEPHVGFAWIMVIREGAAAPDQNVIAHADIKALRPGSVLGWAEDHIFAYIDRDTPGGSWAEEILSGPAPAGFHLMRASGKGGTDLEAIRECKAMGRISSTCMPMIDPLLRESRADTRVPVRLTPDLGTLRLPVFALPDEVEQAFGIGGGT